MLREGGLGRKDPPVLHTGTYLVSKGAGFVLLLDGVGGEGETGARGRSG